jgi:hypothetical protein
MTQEIAHPILRKAIQTMDVSKEFKTMAKANGYKTLQDILNHSLHELPFKNSSGYRILKELMDILDDHELSMYLDE